MSTPEIIEINYGYWVDLRHVRRFSLVAGTVQGVNSYLFIFLDRGAPEEERVTVQYPNLAQAHEVGERLAAYLNSRNQLPRPRIEDIFAVRPPDPDKGVRDEEEI